MCVNSTWAKRGGADCANYLRACLHYGWANTFTPFLDYSSNDVMADPPVAAKTKVAVTRKHLRRDQAAARKARSNALPGSDSIKERQVPGIACSMIFLCVAYGTKITLSDKKIAFTSTLLFVNHSKN